MVTLYWIAFLPPRKSYRIGILLTHMNGDFDTISMTERNCVTPISKVESRINYGIGFHTRSLQCRRILSGRNLVRVGNIFVAAIFDFMTVED